MAKLSARGRGEIGRLSREKDTPESDLTIWEKTTFAFMNDGTILQKRDVIFKPDQYNPKGKRHSHGWKKYGKLKPGLDPEEGFKMWEKELKNKGFVKESLNEVDSTYKLYGKVYKTKKFKTDKEANEFMEKNPGWGVIGVEGDENRYPRGEYAVHVAKNINEEIKFQKEKYGNKIAYTTSDGLIIIWPPTKGKPYYVIDSKYKNLKNDEFDSLEKAKEYVKKFFSESKLYEEPIYGTTGPLPLPIKSTKPVIKPNVDDKKKLLVLKLKQLIRDEIRKALIFDTEYPGEIKTRTKDFQKIDIKNDCKEGIRSDIENSSRFEIDYDNKPDKNILDKKVKEIARKMQFQVNETFIERGPSGYTYYVDVLAEPDDFDKIEKEFDKLATSTGGNI